MAKSRARARIEARIHERVAHCVEFELNDPRSAFITVTGAEVTPDLSVAKVLYSVYGSEADKNKVARMLEDATGFVRKQIARVLKTRRVPHLRWEYDDSVERLAAMDDAIANALRRDREINPNAHRDVPLEPETGPSEDAQLESEYLEYLDTQETEES